MFCSERREKTACGCACEHGRRAESPGRAGKGEESKRGHRGLDPGSTVGKTLGPSDLNLDSMEFLCFSVKVMHSMVNLMPFIVYALREFSSQPNSQIRKHPMLGYLTIFSSASRPRDGRALTEIATGHYGF